MINRVADRCQHVVGLGDGDIEIADSPSFVVSELIFGREAWMGLSVTLNVSRLVERLPPGSLR